MATIDMSTYKHQLIYQLVVLDRMSKQYGPSVCNGCGINTATLELVDECLVVVGSYRGPASVLHLGVENCD